MSVSDDDADVKGNAVDAPVGAEVVPPSMAEAVALITAETDAIAIAENALKKGVDKSMEEFRVLDKSAEVLEEVEKQEVEKQEFEKLPETVPQPAAKRVKGQAKAKASGQAKATTAKAKPKAEPSKKRSVGRI